MAEASEIGTTQWPFDPEEVRRVHSTDEIFANVAPLGEDESFEIEDLSDEEWEAFWAAINE
jgi:hypothetical protein